MKIVRGYKTELDLNDRQRTACAQHAGAARYAYNWGLRRKIDAYETTGQSPTAMDLHRELNALKKTELVWMYEVSKWELLRKPQGPGEGAAQAGTPEEGQPEPGEDATTDCALALPHCQRST